MRREVPDDLFLESVVALKCVPLAKVDDPGKGKIVDYLLVANRFSAVEVDPYAATLRLF